MDKGILPDKTIFGEAVPAYRADLPLRANAIRIFIIVIPPQWIGFDVTGDPVHFVFVADDVFPSTGSGQAP